jgi:hypothetical protein
MPKLRTLWFKTHWKNFPQWYKKVESSMKDTVRRYMEQQELDVEIMADDDDLRRRKLPAGSNHHDAEFEALMAVNTSLLTGATSRKSTKFMAELDVYLDEAAEDLKRAEGSPQSSHAIPLKGDPIVWWERVGSKRFPLLHKIALDYLAIPGTR